MKKPSQSPTRPGQSRILSIIDNIIAPQRREASLTRRKKQYHPKIPDYELESLARCLLPDMQAYFESNEGKRAFAEWQAQRQKQGKGKNGTKPE